MSAIFCGIGGDIIKKLSNALFDGFNKLFEIGMEIDEIKKEKDDDGSDVLYCTIRTGGDHLVKVKMTRLKDDRWDMLCQAEVDGTMKKKEIQNITPDKADDELTKLIDDWFDGETYEGIDDTEDLFEGEKQTHKAEAASNIRLAFKSVKGSTSTEVQLTGVMCSMHNVREAAEAVETLLSDDEFVKSVPEEEAVYELAPLDDSFELTELDPASDDADCTCNCYEILMALCKKAIDDMCTIKWNLRPVDKNLICLLSDRKWILESMIEQLAGLSVEAYGYAPDAKSLCCTDEYIDTTNGICIDCAVDTVKQDIYDIINSLEMFYVNMPSDIQYLFDSWTRDLRSYVNNVLARQFN